MHARSSTPSEQHSENRWGAVLLVALATFIVVAAEMMPVGLLTPIGVTLAQSEGTIGLSLTITGLVAAATAPFVPVLTSRIDRRTTLVVLMFLVAVANSLTAVSPNFAVMAAARILLGMSMGGVWALAASLAPKLVKPRSVGLGTTIIFSGIAVASVLGVPAGAYIGAAFGWNAAFWVLAAAATMITLAMIVVLPKMPPGAGVPLSSLSAAYRNPGVRVGLAITAFIVTAHFAAYTYVRPALESFAGLNASLIGTMLLIYGILGIIGNFIAGPTAAKTPKAVVTILSLGIAATLALFPSLATSTIAAALLMAAWGLFYGGISVSTQAWTAQAEPAHREAVAALWVSIFNASIALGSFTGGQIYDGAGPNIVFWITAGTATLAFLLAIYPKVGPGK
ncbi:Predicted arabinose efflux permease, MFS family [Arthrobacter alpinus]|uniref:Predicted arabinose efflux permease, MFS family n=2 Tax=Arthrobacter alpinus TaxID=656366 RepID=A0A1H5PES0_9MICC|nr:Predicted arabinose efflux permease, MFS family [Arthrobacter alpinus]